jgi:hypothetical protein
VFPNAILWRDPVAGTGILVGSADDEGHLGASWPGFQRTAAERTLSQSAVRNAVQLDRESMRRYADHGQLITDDNQSLAYGRTALLLFGIRNDSRKENFRLLDKAARR